MKYKVTLKSSQYKTYLVEADNIEYAMDNTCTGVLIDEYETDYEVVKAVKVLEEKL